MTLKRFVLRSCGTFLALALLPVLAGCGFQPLYASPDYARLSGVEVEAGPDRLGYLVEDALSEVFGAGRSAYRLDVDATSVERALGVSAQAQARRYAVDFTARYSLERGGERVHRGLVSERVYYDAPRDAYALISARRAAEERGAEALARLVARDVALALRRIEAGYGVES